MGQKLILGRVFAAAARPKTPEAADLVQKIKINGTDYSLYINNSEMAKQEKYAEIVKEPLNTHMKYGQIR